MLRRFAVIVAVLAAAASSASGQGAIPIPTYPRSSRNAVQFSESDAPLGNPSLPEPAGQLAGARMFPTFARSDQHHAAVHDNNVRNVAASQAATATLQSLNRPLSSRGNPQSSSSPLNTIDSSGPLDPTAGSASQEDSQPRADVSRIYAASHSFRLGVKESNLLAQPSTSLLAELVRPGTPSHWHVGVPSPGTLEGPRSRDITTGRQPEREQTVQKVTQGVETSAAQTQHAFQAGNRHTNGAAASIPASFVQLQAEHRQPEVGHDQSNPDSDSALDMFFPSKVPAVNRVVAFLNPDGGQHAHVSGAAATDAGAGVGELHLNLGGGTTGSRDSDHHHGTRHAPPAPADPTSEPESKSSPSRQLTAKTGSSESFRPATHPAVSQSGLRLIQDFHPLGPAVVADEALASRFENAPALQLAVAKQVLQQFETPWHQRTGSRLLSAGGFKSSGRALQLRLEDEPDAWTPPTVAEEADVTLKISGLRISDVLRIVLSTTLAEDGTKLALQFEQSSIEEALESLAVTHTAHIAFSDKPLTDEQLVKYSVLRVPVFATAVELCYYLPQLSAVPGLPPILLDFDTILRLLTTDETVYWDDAQILALNPTLGAAGVLPHIPVTFLTRADSGAIASIMRYLQSAPFTVNTTLVMEHIAQFNTTLDSVKQHVSTPGSILITIGFVAREFLLTSISMINKAGTVVRPSADAVAFSLMEFGGSFDENLRVDLVNPLSTFAWPITIFLGVTVALDNPVEACEIRAAIQKTLYQTILAIDQLPREARDLVGVVPFPDFALDGFLETVNARFRCQGQLLAPVANRAAVVMMGSGVIEHYQLKSQMTTQHWTTIGPGVLITNNAHLSPTRLGLLALQDVDALVSTLPPSLVGYGQQPGYLEVPLFFGSLSIISNLPFLPSNETLVLELETVARIFAGFITHWNDPTILSANPNLAASFPAEPITPAVVGGMSEFNYLFSSIMMSRFPWYAASVTPGPMDGFPPGFYRVSEERHTVAFVDSTPYSISMSMGLTDPNFRQPRVAKIRSSGVETHPTVDLAACSGAFDASLGLFDVLMAGPSCYPLAFVSSYIFQLPTPSSDCYYAALPVLGAARFLQDGTVPYLRLGTSRFGISHLPVDIANDLIDQLLAIKCGGEPVISQEVPCQIGEVRVSKTLCVPCSAGSFTPVAGGPCVPCPAGAVCEGGSHIAAQEGYWEGKRFDFYKCQNSDVCCPSGGCQRNITAISLGMESSVCAPDRDPLSPMCGKCLGDKIMWMGNCTACDGFNFLLFFGFLIVSVAAVWVLLRMRSSSFAFFKLFTDYVQLASVVTGSPRSSILFIDLLSFRFSSGLKDINIPCLWRTSSLAGIVIPSLWPLLLFVILGVMFLMERLCARRADSERHSVMAFKYLDAAWRLLLLSFTVLMMSGFRLMHCESVDDVSVLSNFHHVECYTPEHAIVIVFAGTLVSLFCLVVPVGVTAVHFAALGGDYKNLKGVSRVIGRVLTAMPCGRYLQPQRQNSIITRLTSQRPSGFESSIRASQAVPESAIKSRRPPHKLNHPGASKLQPQTHEPTGQPRETVPSRSSIGMLQVVQTVGRYGVLRDHGEEFGAWVKPQYRVWYEAFFLLRRIACVLIFVFVSGRVMMRALLFVLLVMLYTLQLELRPYTVTDMNRMGNIAMACVVVVAGLELGFARDENLPALADPGDMILVALILPAVAMLYFMAKAYVYEGRGPPWLQAAVKPLALALPSRQIIVRNAEKSSSASKPRSNASHVTPAEVSPGSCLGGNLNAKSVSGAGSAASQVADLKASAAAFGSPDPRTTGADPRPDLQAGCNDLESRASASLPDRPGAVAAAGSIGSPNLKSKSSCLPEGVVEGASENLHVGPRMHLAASRRLRPGLKVVAVQSIDTESESDSEYDEPGRPGVSVEPHAVQQVVNHLPGLSSASPSQSAVGNPRVSDSVPATSESGAADLDTDSELPGRSCSASESS